MKTLAALIIIWSLSGCVTTTNPDGSESKALPGIIGGEKGSSDWCATVKIMGNPVASACFQGERHSEPEE